MKTRNFPVAISTVLVLLGLGSAQTSDFAARIPMHDKGYATYYVSGSINDVVASDFLVDTGSGYVAINAATLEKLAENGNPAFVKNISAVLADGSETVVPIYRLARLKLGDACTIEDVEAAVLPGDTPNILGLSALRKAAPIALSMTPPTLTLSSCRS